MFFNVYHHVVHLGHRQIDSRDQPGKYWVAWNMKQSVIDLCS